MIRIERRLRSASLLVQGGEDHDRQGPELFLLLVSIRPRSLSRTRDTQLPCTSLPPSPKPSAGPDLDQGRASQKRLRVCTPPRTPRPPPSGPRPGHRRDPPEPPIRAPGHPRTRGSPVLAITSCARSCRHTPSDQARLVLSAAPVIIIWPTLLRTTSPAAPDPAHQIQTDGDRSRPSLRFAGSHHSQILLAHSHREAPAWSSPGEAITSAKASHSLFCTCTRSCCVEAPLALQYQNHLN